MLRIIIALSFLPLLSFAETTTLSNEAQWEVTEGSSDIGGDAGPTTKEAKLNWDKACKDWKNEFRADNKENKIINMNCGKPECGGEVGNRTCTSTASYKIKTKLN